MIVDKRILGNEGVTAGGAGDLLADGTVPLTANWDVGAFTITALRFVSDVATGTAPFTVASTTVVANLNADLLDGIEASAFLLKAGGTMTGDLDMGNRYIRMGTGLIGYDGTASEGLSFDTSGGATFTSSLVADAGNESAFNINYTVNKAAGNDTGIKLNMTDTASPGTSYLMDLQVGGASKFSVSNGGAIKTDPATGSVNTSYVLTYGNNATLSLGYARNFVNNNTVGVRLLNVCNFTQTGGTTNTGVSITPVINQATGTGNMTDLLIDRTETAVGTGTQNLIAGQVGGIERFSISNIGDVSFAGANSQATEIKKSTTLLSITAAATVTATNLIPAGCMVVGVTTRVTTAVTGDAGFTGFDIGDGTDADRWGANVDPSLNEITDLTDCTVTTPPIYAADTSIVLTQIGGSTFNAGGVVRVTVHYVSLVAGSS